MRTATEILNGVDDSLLIEILGLVDYNSVIKTIELAQKEAYNKAITEALKYVSKSERKYESIQKLLK